MFTISRSGGDWTHGLFVLLQYGGSAMPRSDYDPLPDWVEIPAGQASVELLVTAGFDELAEGDETVAAALQPDPTLGPVEHYRVDPAQATARVVLHDRTPPGLPVVAIIATDPLAREGTNSSADLNTATFVVSRVGPTNTTLSVRFLVGGTASNGVDYAAIAGPLLLLEGQRSARIMIKPMDDNRPEPIETVVVTLVADDSAVPRYTLGTPRRAAAIIVDNDRPRPNCLRLPDGLFNLCLPAGTNSCFRVEVTRDLKEWTPLCTVPASDGWAHFVDPDAPGLPHRFYRCVPVPCEP